MGMEADGTILINGAMGITRIQRVSNFTIGIVLVLATVAVVLNLIRSRTGRAITAIRDNEIAAQSVGINLTPVQADRFCGFGRLCRVGRRAVRAKLFFADGQPV